MKKLAAPILNVIMLSGCAVPVAVSVVSLVADGVSYVTTEKSLTDHGLSMMSGNDCAMYRMITTGYVCHPYETEDVAIAANDEASAENLLPSLVAHGYTTSAYQSVTDVRTAPVVTPVVKVEDMPMAGVYMVIASGRDHRAAEHVASHFADASARIFAQAAAPNKNIFRVVAGPITEAQYPAAQAYARQRGIPKVWALMIEDHDWRAGQLILAEARQVVTETAYNQ